MKTAFLTSLLLLSTLQAFSQSRGPAPGSQDEPLLRAGVRAGALSMDNEAFETVYGGTLPMLGADASLRIGRRWSVRFTGETARVDGELFIPVPDAPAPELDLELDMVVAHLTLLRAFPFASRWNVRSGLGASYVSWREEAEFDSTSGSAAGAHVLAELVYHRGRWEVGPSLLYWIAPDALPDSGLAGILDERALGGFQLSITGARRFGSR